MFFRDAFLDLIFLHFMLIFCEKVRFLDPLGIRWDPKWRPKSPKWRQKCSRNLVRGIPSETNAPNILFGTPLVTILVDFGCIFDGFWWILASFLRFFWCNSSRGFLPTPAWENLKNKQKPAETCTHILPAKMQSSQNTIEYFPFLNCQQLHRNAQLQSRGRRCSRR